MVTILTISPHHGGAHHGSLSSWKPISTATLQRTAPDITRFRSRAPACAPPPHMARIHWISAHEHARPCTLEVKSSKSSSRACARLTQNLDGERQRRAQIEPETGLRRCSSCPTSPDVCVCVCVCVCMCVCVCVMCCARVCDTA